MAFKVGEERWNRHANKYRYAGEVREVQGKSTKYRRVTLKSKILKWDAQVQRATPRFKQAKHLIAKFGGIMPFSVAVGVFPETIIAKWLVDGIIPTSLLPRILHTARYFGILLRPQDIYPDFVEGDGFRNYTDAHAWANSLQENRTCKKMRHFTHELASLA